MASAEKTLRLIFPDWQHGANPGSGFVPRFLASIAPQGEHSETVEITPGDVSPERTQNEVVAARALTILSPEDFKVCYNAAREVLDAKAPDRVIAFSTDGAACVAPIDYLNEKYEGFGVLWLDVHREPVTPERFWRKRAALFSTFTGDAAQIPGLMKTSIPPSRFFFVSTRADEVPPSSGNRPREGGSA